MTTEQRPHASAPSRRKLPGLAVAAINVAIVFHLLALGALVLSPPNGPWYVPYFTSPGSLSAGPQFAAVTAQVTTRCYLQPLGLSNNYHFESSRTDLPTIYLEEVVHGKAKGKKEKIPDTSSNMWVRYRQRLLMTCLGMDSPFMPRPAAPGIAASDMPKINFFCLPYDAVIQKLMLLKGEVCKTRKRFLDELAKKLNADELERYQEEVLRVVEDERFQFAQADKLPEFDQAVRAGTIKAGDAESFNDWLGKMQASPPPGVPASAYMVPYIVTEKLLQSVRNLDPPPPPPVTPDAKMFYLYEADENQMPKMQQVATPAPASLIVTRSVARYLQRQRNEPVELVRINRSPLGPSLMFPNPEVPGKLLIDAPPPNYNLEIMFYDFGDGRPRPWSPK